MAWTTARRNGRLPELTIGLSRRTAGRWLGEHHVRIRGHSSVFGQHLLDLIFPKDFQSDNPDMDLIIKTYKSLLSHYKLVVAKNPAFFLSKYFTQQCLLSFEFATKHSI
jgi:hypothetical protein